MNTHHKIHRVILSSVLLIVLTACAGGGPAPSEGLVPSGGFACPEPNPRVEFASDTINIFTWTEYVPADMFDCFGLVYGVTVNVDYFSSNEELYSKVSLIEGINPYDVIHPSDYMIEVLIREKLLQELDTSRLPNLANLNAGLSAAYGETLSYVVP